MLKLFFTTAILFCAYSSWAKVDAFAPQNKAGKKPSFVVLYTEQQPNQAEESENLTDVSRFAIETFDRENGTKTDVNLIRIDDRDNPQEALKSLKKVAVEGNPLAVIGPIYSNVAMGLKDFINESEIPLISIFATHNDLTKNSNFIFRICASNRRLVKTMAEYLIPEVQKHNLNILSFKDLSDDYSMDLADTFRTLISGVKANYDETLFKGVQGVERLRDINTRMWTPTKKDILFMPTRDEIAARILASLESEPYLVAAIDTVDFIHLVKRAKPQKTHIRLVTTSQWLPGKSEYSRKIEESFEKKFRRKMSIVSALTYDAAYAATAAFHRSTDKGIPMAQALRDGTKIHGVTGLIYIGHDGERVFSDQFLKEEVIE